MKAKCLEYLWIIMLLLFAGIYYGEETGKWNSFDPAEVSDVKPSLKEKEDIIQEEPESAGLSSENNLKTDSESNTNANEIPENLEQPEVDTTVVSSDYMQTPSGDASAELPPTDSDVTEPKVGFYIDENQMICNFYDGNENVQDGYLILPAEGCVGIRSGAFTSYFGVITELFIPSNITQIERSAFVGMDGLEWLDVDSKNTQVQSIDGILYDSGMQEMIAYPTARTGGYSMPSTITTVWTQAFYNTALSKIDLLDCGYVQFEADAFGPNRGAGLTIRVPAQYEADYRTALLEYAVQIESVGP